MQCLDDRGRAPDRAFLPLVAAAAPGAGPNATPATASSEPELVALGGITTDGGVETTGLHDVADSTAAHGRFFALQAWFGLRTDTCVVDVEVRIVVCRNERRGRQEKGVRAFFASVQEGRFLRRFAGGEQRHAAGLLAARPDFAGLVLIHVLTFVGGPFDELAGTVEEESAVVREVARLVQGAAPRPEAHRHPAG